jgi:hypothetical protein
VRALSIDVVLALPPHARRRVVTKTAATLATMSRVLLELTWISQPPLSAITVRALDRG